MSYLLSYYGDDFTGSTDVMEALTLGGIPTVLFLEPPGQAQLDQFPAAKAIGIAGTSRSMTLRQMNAHLPEMFKTLKALNADFCHYKVCSTFDSSPELGNIGRALELALEQFPQAFIPLIVGAPILKRYVIFGNLFATADALTYRLDRHPTMSQHPVTPMSESDIRQILAKQTHLSSSLLDYLSLNQGVAASQASLKDLDTRILLCDTLSDDNLKVLGELLFRFKEQGIHFVAGSSGLEYAIIRFLAHTLEPAKLKPLPEVKQMIVMSGSASATTARQILEAEKQGFTLIRINSADLIQNEQQTIELERLKALANTALEAGKSVLLFTALGPDDPALAKTRQALSEQGYLSSDSSRILGTAQGKLLKELLLTSGLRRACITGGDTCGYVTHQLGIYALELRKPVAPGSPLCLAHAHEKTLHGLELALKAGQVGRPDYFISLQKGG